MSISSSLAAGVSGLNANAQRLSTISDNIANSATYGYKRMSTDFHSMVVGEGNGARYTAGGVRTSQLREIQETGQLQNTSNSTDIAINGRGFLPVTTLESAESGGNLDLLLATTGSFRANDEGILVDGAGKVLLGWPAGPNGEFPAFPRDGVGGLEPINVFHNQYTASPTSEVTVSANLPSDASDPANLGEPQNLNVEYFGNLGQTESLDFTFTPTGTINEWELQIYDSNSDSIVGDYTLSFSDANAGGGMLENVVANAGGAYDPATGTIELAVGGGTIMAKIGGLGDPSGMTQLDSNFAPTQLSKNGAAAGSLRSVEIDGNGIVHGIYETGQIRPIYQVPVIDVPNPVGLVSTDGQSYRVSPDSGTIFLWDAGAGPVGTTEGFTREASTVDVAKELTDLIQTQRAYSSNAKIIQTVDEMLQETMNLKR
ncbi:flagellar hook protein FlgE [Palleronia aestuarii]|uniref:Flagellar hook protein FlgE n=1 Tax=Palleronia aestuarii TaxID=568105 RepID=A0A2W7P0C3_9RHOB|nr:flagellar hook-basal body complex protein [Palleronia aestuarii]PZX18916.1 flagellar hook protein FlgE [Palleronia aestuarii]